MKAHYLSHHIQSINLCSYKLRKKVKVKGAMLTEIEVEQDLTSHQTHYRSYHGRIFTHLNQEA